MRYQSWDVLLFPQDSRTPIQEFDTKCFVLDQSQWPSFLARRWEWLT
jgi:hypothetical protein